MKQFAVTTFEESTAVHPYSGCSDKSSCDHCLLTMFPNDLILVCNLAS